MYFDYSEKSLLSLLLLTLVLMCPYKATAQPPSGTGAAVVPADPPPTQRKMTLPSPKSPSASPDRPLTVSPTISSLTGRPATDPITINDSVAIALSVNRALAYAGQALYRAQGRTSEARSGLNPTLGATPGDVYLHDAARLSVGVQATLPIDITGLLHAATDQAHFQEIGARLDINRTRNQIVYDVQTAFYNGLRAQALVKVAVDNLQNSLDRLHDAQIRFSAQAVSYFDVVRAQTDVANSQKQLILARNEVSLSISRLNSTMGVEVTSPVRLSTAGAVEEPPGVAPPAPIILPEPAKAVDIQSGRQLPDVPVSTTPLPDNSGITASRADEIMTEALRSGPELQRLLTEAVKTRPELLEADANIAAAKKGILIARRSLLPSLSVSVGYFDIRSSTGTPINEPEALIGLNVPIYDAGISRARVQQAQGDVSSAITVKRDVLDQVTLDVQQAYLNLIQARDQVAVANQAVAQARTGFQLARVRYNAGVASKAGISPILEVSDAQTALTLAEQNRVNALYEYNGARARLDWSIGRFAYTGNGPGFPDVPAAILPANKH